MEISAVKMNVDQGSWGQSGPNSSANQSSPLVAVAPKGDNSSTNNATNMTDATTTEKKTVNVAELKKMADEMNHSLESMDTNIRFKYHDKTKELMVQVVDQTNDKVLREIPSHEFLNTIAAIREYVGMLVDKKM